MTCKDINICIKCPIRDECDRVDKFCEYTYDSEIIFDHELLAKIYTKGRIDALREVMEKLKEDEQNDE